MPLCSSSGRSPAPRRSGWSPQPHAPVAEPPLLVAIAEGARFVIGDPLLRAIGLCASFWNFAFIALLAGFVPFALARLGTDAAGAGLAQGVNGLGMIAGAAAAPFIFARVQPRAVQLFGPLSSALGAVLMVLSPRFGGLAMAALAFGLIGIGPRLWLVPQTSVRRNVDAIGPDAAGHRHDTRWQICGIRPIGALAGGSVAQVVGTEAATGLVAAAFARLGNWSRSPRPLPGLRPCRIPQQRQAGYDHRALGAVRPLA